jgi:hypothetical protein
MRRQYANYMEQTVIGNPIAGHVVRKSLLFLCKPQQLATSYDTEFNSSILHQQVPFIDDLL